MDPKYEQKLNSISLPESAARRGAGGLAWSMWGITALSTLLQIFLEFSSGDIVAGVMESFALNAVQVSLLLGIYYYTYAALQIPAGFILDRFGARWVLFLGGLVCASGCFLFALAPGWILAAIGRFLMGVGTSFSFIGALYIARCWFPVRRFTFMVTCTETVGMIGTIGGVAYMAVLVQQWGWRVALLGVGGVALLISVLIALFVRDQPAQAPFPMQRLSFIDSWLELRALLKMPKMWMIALYTGLLLSTLITFASLWAIPYFQLAYGMSLMTATWAANAAFLGVAIGGPILGWLDSHTRYRRPLLIFSTLISAGLLLFLIHTPNLPVSVILVGMGLLGVFSSGYLIPFGVGQEISPPQRQGVSNGFISMISIATAPLLIQPIVAGVLDFCAAHRGGLYTVSDYKWALSVLPVVVGLSVFLVHRIPNKPSIKLE